MTGRHSGDDESTAAGRPADPPPDSPSIAGEPVEFSRPPVIGSSEPLAVSALGDSPPVSGAGDSGLTGGRKRLGDRVFFGFTSGAGAFIVALVVLVGVFLIVQAIPAIKNDHDNFITSRAWTVGPGIALHFGVLNLLWVTVIVSAIAMLLAVPISIGIALFMTQYVPKRAARPIGYVIDLLAAIPSIIYGIWGIVVLSPKLEPVQRALYHLGGFPIFKDNGFVTGTIFDGGIVLAIMILPIITAIARDVFERTPRQNVEAAWALGATKWEMIRLAVLPYGRPGVISGCMLGLGRALGETIAITLILSATSGNSKFSFSIFNGGESFASKIANSASEFPQQPGPYIAAGLVLFVLTFLVNASARAIVNRRKEFS